MKRFLLWILIAFSFSAKAQVYNNEWIDYSKTYYKFKVGATKLYRITQATLASIGLDNTPAEHFQLWRNGQEVPVYTSVQAGAFASGDYIEFWGEMNDGKPDNILYREPDYQLSDKWSLQTDTAAFFLTVNTSGSNLRLQPTLNNVAGNSLPPEPFFMHTAGNYYRNRIHSGRAELVGDSYTYSSSYDYGEGLTSNDIATGATLALNLAHLKVYTGPGAPGPVIKINAAGNAVRPRYFKVTLNGDSVYAQTINYYDYAKITVPVTIAQLTINPTNNTANIQITNKCALPSDRMIVAQTELIYPRQFNFASATNVNATNFSFELPANASGNYLEITGFAPGGIPPVLYDLTNGKRYQALATTIPLKFALQPSAVDRKLVLVSQAAANITGITLLEQRNFTDYSLAANQGNYIIITHPSLTTASNGTNPIEEYRVYRSSPQGGTYNAKVYMIQELVDQFGLGIKQNPLSIRNFLRWARANYTAPLKNVFLIGKGLAYPQFKVNESNADIGKLALVPSFGFPASDNLLSAVGGSSVPLTPIGRISVINGEEVVIYLNKVQQYEQASATSSPLIQDKAWMKNIVHVVGANDDGTTNILVNALNGHKQIIEDTLYGGKVYTFTKNSADAIEQLNNAKLTSLFNEGIGLLTYFGHSSANTLEFNLDNPMNYNNPGKYPVFIVMGCNAGNFFNFNPIRLLTTETLSEKYVLAPERGSIAFIASTHLGIVHYLDIYNTKMYAAISRTHYGQTLGEIMDETITQVFGLTTENDFYARFQCEQFTLHGDPALKLYNFPKPDYVIEDQLVKTSPTVITVAEPEFKVDAQIMNIGQSPNKDIVVEIKRTYPNLTTELIRRDTIPGVRYSDLLSYIIPIVATRDKGLNKITITVDPDNAVDELFETNNSITKDVIIYDNEARPVYPYNFSIVNNQNVKLTASTADPFSSMREYIMQLDTTELFNSPLKITRTVNTVGGILEFVPGGTFIDSTVYYWRVGPKPPTTDTVWNVSSFIFLSNYAAGFNQSHFYQQAKINGNRILIDSASRNWKFRNIFKNIFARIGTYVSSGATQPLALSVAIDGDYKTGFMSWFQSVVFNVFDPGTFTPMLNQVVIPGTSAPILMGEGLYQSLAPQNPSQSAPIPLNFEYRYTDSTKRRKAMQFMRDVIPDGSYVVVRSFLLDSIRFPNTTQFPQKFASHWQADQAVYGVGNTMYDYFKDSIGFTDIDLFNRSRNWVLVYKKNDPSFIPKWTFTEGTFDNTTLSVDCPSSDSLGFMTSPLLGPAKAWHDLHWRGKTIDTSGGDSPTVDIIGVRANGSEATVISGLTVTEQDYDVSSIDVFQFPYLKLQLRNSDSVHYTPYQLDYWRLTYDPVPEGGVTPDFSFQFKDTVEVGEPANFKMAFKNISDISFDSLLVKLVVIDQNNLSHVVVNEKKKPLVVGDTVVVSHTLETGNFAGNNQVYFEFNPDNNQPEQHHFNNYAFRSLYVKGDSLNPLLDVTFDGVHILNRDIVSSKPDIIIKLKDEAKWMILDDTSLLTLNIRYPDGSLRGVYFDNDTLKFIPAGQAPNPDNTATINFSPYFQQDGDYELIVSGKDKSENSAGNIQYKVAFQVINKPMISNMLNYPNPFTTSTAFVFTITGSEVPQNIRIQILTITGKIVRDITKDELGPLHIGRNITEFKWDGTDQYGQKLANGIYLYRVITNLNGKSLDKYKAEGDNTDKYFNKGYGKMYLMR